VHIQVSDTALHKACAVNSVTVLERLIKAGADLAATDQVSHRPFILFSFHSLFALKFVFGAEFGFRFASKSVSPEEYNMYIVIYIL
jgi:hypothetical protein